MIEVEKKFILQPEEQERLIDKATFVNERTFTDIYYDQPEFNLTSKDQWLRAREGRFELKLPLHQGLNRLADQYEELEDELKMRAALNLPITASLIEDLKSQNYKIFCECRTIRRKYQKAGFTIDLDEVAFDKFTYHIGEIELMVNDKAEINQAIKQIMQFAKNQSLIIAPVRGKVIEYLWRTSPAHYNALIEAGVVRE